MKIEPYQLEKYNTVMAERIKEATKEDHIIHGYMIYQCECCHNIYMMWLEKGLEDLTDDQKTGRHKPVPFSIICPCCGGMTRHVLWSIDSDSLGKNYRSYREYVNQPNIPVYRNFFWNDPDSDCGIPVIFEPDYHIEFNRVTNAIVSMDIPTELPTARLNPAELFIEGEVNREQRRHGIFGKDGYKRPKSNKKLYEY